MLNAEIWEDVCYYYYFGLRTHATLEEIIQSVCNSFVIISYYEYMFVLHETHG